MNHTQLEACKEKLPDHAAREFERLQLEANALLTEGWRLRRLAWKFYRNHQRNL